MSSSAPRAQVVVRRLWGLARTTILQPHQVSILRGREGGCLSLYAHLHTCIADKIAILQPIRSYCNVGAFYESLARWPIPGGKIHLLRTNNCRFAERFLESDGVTALLFLERCDESQCVSNDHDL